MHVGTCVLRAALLLGLVVAVGGGGSPAVGGEIGRTELALDEAVTSSELIRVLNNTRAIVELVELPAGERQGVLARLYSVPVPGECVPGTHATCAFDYYLAVSEYDEQPRQAVFHLGVAGEITDLAWVSPPSPEANAATLGFKVASYPASAVSANPNLEKRADRYQIRISVDALTRIP